MLLSQGDASTSERILFEALEQSKGLPWRDGLRQMALLYSYTNRSADAAEWIRKAIQLCPPDAGRECAPLYTDYGDILKDLSHLNRSAEASKTEFWNCLSNGCGKVLPSFWHDNFDLHVPVFAPEKG